MDGGMSSPPALLAGATRQSTGPEAPDLSTIPPTLIISAHFTDAEVKALEKVLYHHGAPLTSDASMAKVFIGKVGTKKRAEFELRSRKIQVDEVVSGKRGPSPAENSETSSKRSKSGHFKGKRVRTDDEGSTTEEEVDDTDTETEEISTLRIPHISTTTTNSEKRRARANSLFEATAGDDIIWVVKMDWLHECIAAKALLPLDDHLVYKGKVKERPISTKPRLKSIKPFFSSPLPNTAPASQTKSAARPLIGQSILERAKSEIANTASKPKYSHKRESGHGSRRFEGKTYTSSAQQIGRVPLRRAHLLLQTTSDYEGTDSESAEPPDWVRKGVKYACQRFTPANGPNEDFIELLKKIRKARTLIDDEIGVRAYSTIIASIAAYPYKLTHPREIIRLPGCEDKAERLWIEWKNTGKIQAVEDYEIDEAMKVLRSFYDIWGVGAKTARQFYYNNNWTDLDDIIEFGWNDLDRVQQIGVKYYDEFLEPIPRAEVEQIADVVREYAVRLRGDKSTVTIVGGYRRGKLASGDVDMIISHPDLDATAGLVKDIVEALEEAEWITHTLTMSLNNTNRGQNTLQFRTTRASGAGFDTLDKALVVWQDPHWPTREQDLAANPRAKNPNIHRRVDIIVSPWRTVGCAVMGWSGGTTFQRDLRRYAKAKKGWKFDSSGIRSRNTGEVVQLEGPNGIEGTPEDAERRVFEGMGLEYVPPDQRCTN